MYSVKCIATNGASVPKSLETNTHSVDNWVLNQIDSVSDDVINLYLANTSVFTVLGKIGAVGGASDVVGPTSATDNAIARFDGTTGKLIQNSAVTIADTTGAITAGAYNTVAISGASTPTLAVTGTTTVSGANTGDNVEVAAQTVGFTITKGTTPKTLTVALDATVSGSNTGDQTPAGMGGLAGTKVYYVSDSSGGTVNRKLTFTNGLLTAET